MKSVLSIGLMALLSGFAAQAQTSQLNMHLKEAVQINCQDSMPVLSGSVLSCETVCQIKVVETYVEGQDCDQVCWPNGKNWNRTVVTVTKWPGNQVLMSKETGDSRLSQGLVDEAKRQAQQSCSKVEIIK